MVRLLVLYNTPEDPQAFDRYYSEIHIPLAKQLPGLLRYTVSRNLAALGGDARYYLTAELDWESLEAMQAALASPIGAETAADVSKFASGGSSLMMYEVIEV
jgi:uncharacterized protein (TIGR02118 family)